jgi:beta-glucosidase-like glycosyl hydrolase
MGAAWTRGVQRGADRKYLKIGAEVVVISDDQAEDGRLSDNQNISLRDMVDTYLVPFEIVTTVGNIQGYMCAYPAINGTPSCANHFLEHKMRGEWGFAGYVESDCSAVKSIYDKFHYASSYAAAAAAALNAGTDMNCGGTYPAHLGEAIAQGLTTEATLDVSLGRHFTHMMKAGAFDPWEGQQYAKIGLDSLGAPASKQLNLEASRQSMVLLKNRGGVLPLKAGKRIAVIGPLGNSSHGILGNYYAQLCPPTPSCPFDMWHPSTCSFACIPTLYQAVARANVGGRTSFTAGCASVNCSNATSFDFDAAVVAIADADVVILAIGVDQTIGGENIDRPYITLPQNQSRLIHAVAAAAAPSRKLVVAVMFNGGSVSVDDWLGEVPALLSSFYPGGTGGTSHGRVCH